MFKKETKSKSYWFWRDRLYKKIELLRFSNKKRVLDVGCGNGDDAVYLSGLSQHVEGFDLQSSPSWKNYASSRLKFSIADASSMPYRGNSFDGVYMKDVLHHADCSGKILLEIQRVTKKNATIIIVEANRYNPLFYFHMTKKHGHEHFTRGQFRALIKSKFPNASFKQFESHYFPFEFFFLARLGTYALEAVFELFPPFRYFQSYNVAIIKI